MEKKCKHDKESECASCGEKFYLIPKKEECNCQYEEGHSLACPLYKEPKNPLESSDFTTKKMEEFDKIFVNENLWKSNNEDTAFVGIGNIKSFLSQSLQQARQHERELIKKEIAEKQKTVKLEQFTVDIINNLL